MFKLYLSFSVYSLINGKDFLVFYRLKIFQFRMELVQPGKIIPSVIKLLYCFSCTHFQVPMGFHFVGAT